MPTTWVFIRQEFSNLRNLAPTCRDTLCRRRVLNLLVQSCSNTEDMHLHLPVPTAWMIEYTHAPLSVSLCLGLRARFIIRLLHQRMEWRKCCSLPPNASGPPGHSQCCRSGSLPQMPLSHSVLVQFSPVSQQQGRCTLWLCPQHCSGNSCACLGMYLQIHVLLQPMTLAYVKVGCKRLD